MTPEEIEEIRKRLASKQTEERMRTVQQMARFSDLDAQVLSPIPTRTE